MLRNTSCIYFISICICAACSGNKQVNDPGSKGNSDSGTTSSEAAAGINTPDLDGGKKSALATCGNKEVKGAEECDDGNMDDSDGCTSLCTFSCHDNAECQKDVCSGAGSTCDNTSHKCTPGAGKKADGEICGDNMACHQGKCVANVCNDGIKQPGEECDDGNPDERDGCTTKCKYSCVTGNKAYPQCANDCDQTATCDDASHKCVAGKPLPENALCKNGQGYCSSGGCVRSVCGDGVQQPNEECDKGKENGAAGSVCTTKCTSTVCGNGVIEGKEQCDDGNTTSLDGCDSNCKLELVYRSVTLSSTQSTVMSGEVPDWCVYSPKNPFNPNKDKTRSTGNAFAKLVTNQDVAQTSDQTVSYTVSSEQMSTLLHLLDVDDPTFNTSDPLVRFGLSLGVPEAGSDWNNTPNKLDFRMQVWKEYYDDQLAPILTFYGEVKIDPASGKAVVQTTKPVPTWRIDVKPQSADAGLMADVPITLIMSNMMARFEVDTPRSKVTAPPESADGMKVPDSSGNYNPQGTTDPTGIICGAIDPILFAKIPMPMPNIVGIDVDYTVMCDVQYNDPTIHLRACPNGQADLDAGKCSSVLDFFKFGCTSSVLGSVMAPLGDPDADVDGDGTYDAYSYVGRMTLLRVRLSTKGFTTSEPPAELAVP